MVDPLLASLSKQWQFVLAQPGGAGEETLEYRVRIRKKTTSADFVGRFRAAAGSLVRKVDLSPPAAG